MTVNFALSLRAHVRIETRDDDRLILESRDRGIRLKRPLDRIDELACDDQLELVSKMVHFFQPETGFHLTARSEAPAGAGISGSSALAIALIGGLNRLVGDRYESGNSSASRPTLRPRSSRCRLVLQDYYPAFYGSTSCIHLDLDGVDRETSGYRRKPKLSAAS